MGDTLLPLGLRPGLSASSTSVVRTRAVRYLVPTQWLLGSDLSQSQGPYEPDS